MAMKMKRLSDSMLLIVSVWILLHCSVAGQPENYTHEIWPGCGNSGKKEFTNGSAFQRNLNHVLDSLVRNVSSSGFSTSRVDEGKNSNATVYGFLQCRGDLGSSECKQCAATAKAELVQKCHNTSGFLQLNGCFLRYDSFNFYDVSSYSCLNVSLCSNAIPEGKRSNSLRITLGVVAASVGSIAVIGLCKWKFVCRRKRWENIARTTGPEIGEEGEVSLCPFIANLELIFKYDILREATSNFKEENKLGLGGFGSVFKGNLPDGRVVAVKRLYKGSSQGDAEFLNEANLISCIQHKNLVKLLGCSFEGSERLLVYEYLPNRSLDNILFDTTKRHLLNWNERYEIIVGTARGLAYLHEESEIRIIHRDIKASNILLDKKLRPKIADFGLARFFAEDRTHVSTGIAGTIGYMAPEYALRGQLTEKADVFSFGVLLLEIISGRKNHILAQDMEFLVEGTWRLYKAEKPLEIMDPTLQGSYSWDEGIRVIKIGLLCTQGAPALRPSMSRVVLMLTGEQENLPSPTRPTFMDLDNVATPNQVKRLTDPDNTSSSYWFSLATTSSRTPSTGNYSAADQVKRPRVIDPDKTSSSHWSSEEASSSRTLYDIHFAAADSSSAILEPG